MRAAQKESIKSNAFNPLHQPQQNRSESGWRTPRASRIPPKKEPVDRRVAIARRQWKTLK
jgi:hypothetical protein